MKLTAALVRLLGRRVLSPLIHGIVAYFFLFGRRARRSAWQYQQRLHLWSAGRTAAPSQRRVFAQFMAFADALLDKLDVWNGKLRLEDIDIQDPAGLRQQLRGARGQMLVGAHLGNLEVCRALAEIGEQVTMNVLVHTRHAERFNRLLGEAGASNLRLIQVSELDPAVMLQLSERLERGEWLAIAGDRSEERRAGALAARRPTRMPAQPVVLPQAKGSLPGDPGALCRACAVAARPARRGHRALGRALCRAPGPLLHPGPFAVVQFLSLLEAR